MLLVLDILKTLGMCAWTNMGSTVSPDGQWDKHRGKPAEYLHGRGRVVASNPTLIEYSAYTLAREIDNEYENSSQINK